MKKKLSLILVLAMLIGVFALAGCGGPEASPYDGKWVGVVMEIEGVIMPISDITDQPCYLNILNAEELEAEMEGEMESCTWSVEGDQFTLTARDGVAVGTLVNENVVVFENMFNTGGSFVFARDGSAEADPAIYLD